MYLTLSGAIRPRSRKRRYTSAAFPGRKLSTTMNSIAKTSTGPSPSHASGTGIAYNPQFNAPSAAPTQTRGGATCLTTSRPTTYPAFERSSKRRKGFPSETAVQRGHRIVHGDKELLERLGRND